MCEGGGGAGGVWCHHSECKGATTRSVRVGGMRDKALHDACVVGESNHHHAVLGAP